MANHRLLSNSDITTIGATSNTANILEHTFLKEKRKHSNDGLLFVSVHSKFRTVCSVICQKTVFVVAVDYWCLSSSSGL